VLHVLEHGLVLLSSKQCRHRRHAGCAPGVESNVLGSQSLSGQPPSNGSIFSEPCESHVKCVDVLVHL
jgi:hypothetical protein